MLPTSTSNIGLQVTVKSGLALLLTTVQMEELQVMMFGSLTNQHTQYWVSSHRQVRTGALVDHGAMENGGIAGDDVWVINRTGQQVDVKGIDNHQIVDIPIVTAGAIVKSQCGEVIIVMH
jgi:hypothetical protein